MSVDRFYKRLPRSQHAKNERRAAMRAAIKAAALPPRAPVTSPVVRQKSRAP